MPYAPSLKIKAQAELEIRRRAERSSLEAKYDWPNRLARPNQLPPPGDWSTWLVLAGRGFGKTRCGVEWTRMLVESGKYGRIALVAPTSADARDVMVEGESGFLATAPPWNRPLYEPSKRRLTWPNGAIATTYSAEEPDRLRGPQHDAALCDELAAWSRAETWDMLMFGLRLGHRPLVAITTTPKPTALLKSIIKATGTVVTRGSTYDNAANLAPTFLKAIETKYEGTRLGRQEIGAEMLEDNPNALWHLSLIDAQRVDEAPPLKRIVVAVDPATTANEDSDETGIVVCGIDHAGRGYVLADRSLKASPNGWAEAAVSAYRVHKADRIVYESNQGGDMVAHTLGTSDKSVPLKGVHASRGKQTRAEPVAALYEQGRVHHVGCFPKLEDQLINWSPGEKSPDRLDAMVYGLTELMVQDKPELRFY